MILLSSQFPVLKKIEDILIIFRCFQYWIIPDFDNLTNYEGFIERYNLIRHTDIYVDHIVKYKKKSGFSLFFTLLYLKKGAQKATKIVRYQVVWKVIIEKAYSKIVVFLLLVQVSRKIWHYYYCLKMRIKFIHSRVVLYFSLYDN